MTTLCCSSTKPYQDRPNASEHDLKFSAFLSALPSISDDDPPTENISIGRFRYTVQLHTSKTTGDSESTQTRYFACLDTRAPVSSPTTHHQPDPPSKQDRVEPYRPRIPGLSMDNEKSLQAESTRKQWGSGWTQQRSSWSNGGNGGGGYNNSNSSNTMPPPRRQNLPATWVKHDAADASNSWRSNRPSSQASTSPRSPAFPTSPKSAFGERRNPYSFARSPPNASNGHLSVPRKDHGGGAKSPALSSAASVSDRDTSSAWETTSNVTWNNRFAMLGSTGGDDYDDDSKTVSDTSDGIDSVLAKKMVELIVPDDDDDFPISRPESAVSWSKGDDVHFVEILEKAFKDAKMVRQPMFKMFRCTNHNAAFKITLYLPKER